MGANSGIYWQCRFIQLWNDGTQNNLFSPCYDSEVDALLTNSCDSVDVHGILAKAKYSQAYTRTIKGSVLEGRDGLTFMTNVVSRYADQSNCDLKEKEWYRSTQECYTRAQNHEKSNTWHSRKYINLNKKNMCAVS